MDSHLNRQSRQQQRRIAKHAEGVDANHFFNLLTSPQLLDAVEAQLPEHRERYYPPFEAARGDGFAAISSPQRSKPTRTSST